MRKVQLASIVAGTLVGSIALAHAPTSARGMTHLALAPTHSATYTVGPFPMGNAFPTVGFPSPAPTPVPSPRTPSSADVAQLTALVSRPSATISSIAIVGSFAEVCWYSGNIGGAILATDTAGSWRKIDSTFGGYSAGDITLRAPSISPRIASQLFSEAAANQI